MAVKKNRERSFKRRKIRIAHFGLQFRYLVVIAVGMLVPLLIVGGVMFAVFWQAAAAELAIPEGIAQFIVPALIRAAVILLFLLPVVCALILWAALIVSNRIAGPLVRLERELRRMADEQKVYRLKIRKSDELSGLVESINQVVTESRRN